MNTNKPLLDCIIIGAGLSGLTAAYRMKQAGYNIKIIEKSGKTGGVIQTEQHKNYQIEHGPNTFLSTASDINGLIHQLNLTVQPASSKAKERFIFYNGQLEPVPQSPGSFLKTPLLSTAGKLTLLKEPFASKAQNEETIAEFTTRRLGTEVLDNLMTPFLTGIYAGDPNHLSIKAVFNSLWQMEQEHGSLVKGMIAKVKQKKRNKLPKKPYQLLSFKQGLSTLINALTKKIGSDSILLNTFCESLINVTASIPNKNKDITELIELKLNDGSTLLTRSIIMATPASATAKLLADLPLPNHHTITENLEHLYYAPMVVVHLAFRKTDFKKAPSGFGFLIPRTQNIDLLGAIYTSELFPERCPAGETLLTCFIGGALNPDITKLNDQSIIEDVIKDLATTTTLNSDSEPIFSTVIRWPYAIPQYGLGHTDRINLLEETLKRNFPQIALASNYLSGVSVNNCVKTGTEAYKTISHYLETVSIKQPQHSY